MKRFIYSVAAAAVFSVSQPAWAACLGLSPPTPKNTNVCEVLLEELVIPQTEVFCDIPTWAYFVMPHCAVPGACHVDPVCKTFEVTQAAEALILNAGDLYCDARDISPESMIVGIREQLYSDAVKLTTGGTSSILYDTANRHIDMMSCAGTRLNSRVKQRLECVSDRLGLTPETSWSGVDANRVTIVSKTNPTADLYLKDGYNAITLNDLVIMEDAEYQILRNWNKDIDDPLTDAEERALVLMIHELVHVRQYRNMGKENFLNNYLIEALAKGYADISKEQEAYAIDQLAEPIVESGCGPMISGDVAAAAEPLTQARIERLAVNMPEALINRGRKPDLARIDPAKIKDYDKFKRRDLDLQYTPFPAGAIVIDEMVFKPDPKACFNAVQGKVAWNHSGSKQWSPANINVLCEGNPTSTEPAECFDIVMHKAKWPGDRKWGWQQASRLCKGAKNKDVRLNCMSDRMKSGISATKAVASCAKG